MTKQVFDRRRQPQITIQAIKEVLQEIDWPIKEITSQKFTAPKGNWVNESFGYHIKVPKEMDYIRLLWLGYLNHKKVTPPGIYAGINPVIVGPNTPTPRSTGYRLPPEGFKAWLLLKEIIPQKEIERMEKQYSQNQIKQKIKTILKRTYPFNKRVKK